MKNCTQSKQINAITLFPCLIIFLMLASIVCSCDVIVRTPAPTANNFTIPPTATKPAIATEIPASTNTPESTAIVTPEPSPTATPEIEVVDGELAESIRRLMPKMWYYNKTAKRFETRDSNELNFLLSKRTRLLIFDKDGNEVGFAFNFVKNAPDAKMTSYYALTDSSINTVIPLRLYSQVGFYGEPSLSRQGYVYYQKCMYAFAHEPKLVPLNYEAPQIALDLTQKYALDLINIEEGEELAQKAILRTIAYILGIDESQLLQDIKNGKSIELETKLGNWVVNNGVDYFWGDTYGYKYDLIEGKLLLYVGDQTNSQVCSPLIWDRAFWRFLNDQFKENFPESLDIYKICSSPYINRYTKQSPVVVSWRSD